LAVKKKEWILVKGRAAYSHDNGGHKLTNMQALVYSNMAAFVSCQVNSTARHAYPD